MKRLVSTGALAALAGAVALAAAPGAASANPEATFAKAGCVACHVKDRKQVGPSFRDIAARYQGQADAVTALMAKVRAGGKGVYGPIPMPPHPPEKISDAELRAVIEWMLRP
jgi:cytochrome c